MNDNEQPLSNGAQNDKPDVSEPTFNSETNPETEATFSPEQEQTVSSPTEPQPAPFGEQPTVVAPPVQPKKSKKGLIAAVIAGSVLLLAGGGFGAYAMVRTNPENAMNGAIANFFLQDSIQSKTKISLDYSTSSGSMDMNFREVTVDLNSSLDPYVDINASMLMSVNGVETKLAGSAYLADNGDLYFRVTDITDAVQSLFGAGAPESFMNKIADLENKWVKVSASDLKEQDPGSADEYQCLIDVYKGLKDDKQAMNDTKKIYENNPFIVYKGDAKKQDGLVGYDIAIDADKSKTFMKEIQDTKLFKDLRACDGEAVADVDKYEATGILDNDDTKITLWANAWSHELKRLEVNAKTESGGREQVIRSVTDLNYDKSVKGQAPQADMSLEEFGQKINDLMSEF